MANNLYCDKCKQKSMLASDKAGYKCGRTVGKFGDMKCDGTLKERGPWTNRG